MQRHIITILLLILSFAGFAQQADSTLTAMRLNVRGTVFEHQTLDPLEGAQVRLTDTEGKLIAGNATLKNGQFLLPNISPGTYNLRVTYMGFAEQKFTLTLPKRSGNFKVADVLMREDAKLLAEATVQGKLPEMTVVEDTVMYNADAFKLEDGALVEELIKKLPGIVLDDNGNYTWNGKSISQILVDGKEFFGNNQNLILKNLPAEIVDKVKAYDKKSDMARITGIDDGEERTVLDLQIKKNRKQGWFGNVDGAYGTHDRYSGRGMLNRFKGDQKFSVVANGNNTDGDGMTDKQSVGATMNYQKPTLELNGSANGQFSQSESERWSNSQSFENKQAAYSNSHNTSNNDGKSFSFNYRVEWKPDSTWNILFRPDVSYSRSRSSSMGENAAFSDNPYLQSADPLRDYQSLSSSIGVNHNLNANDSRSDNLNVRGSLQVNKRLQKPGRNVTLNVDGGYGKQTSESESYSQIDYYQRLIIEQSLSGTDSVYHKVQYNDAPQHNHNVSARLSYSEPVGYNMYLQMSYQYNYRFTDRDRNVSSIFDWMDNGSGTLWSPFPSLGIGVDNYADWRNYSALDVAQCNYTTNTYQNHNIRLQLRINRTLYQLTVGANVQPQINSVDYTKGLKHYDVRQSVVNASPTLNFRYKFSRQEQLDLRYNGNTGQPGITDLIPDTLSNANPLNIRLGNPNLKPSFTHRMSADYRRTIVDKQLTNALNFQFNTTQNSTTNRTEYNETTGGRVSMPVNINGNWNASTSYNFNTAMGEQKYWRINAHTQGSMTNAVGYVFLGKENTTVRNRTRGMHASQSVRLTYRREWESKWNIEANVNSSVRYNHSRSTNTSASNLDTYGFSYGGNFVLRMPWGMTLSSDISEQCRRGYTDANMNTNELLWNATLSQRLLKQKNLTLSVRAIDILNEREDVSRNISATARTDSRSERVRSYVLFSVNYRFGKFGGGNQRGQRGERAGSNTNRGGERGGERTDAAQRGQGQGSSRAEGGQRGGFGGGGRF